MSILSKAAADLGALFFPPRCPVCGGDLPEGSGTICPACRWEMPLTGFCRQVDNPMVRRLSELIPVVQASALFFYSSAGGYRRLVHAFKYRGAWRTALAMGRWLGAELCQSGLYADVDCVVPVPLHPLKRLRRGYNQAEYLAEGVAGALGCRMERSAVRRSVHRPSQTHGGRMQRWANVEGIFAVRRPERLAGCHVLVVDDVFTTGATVCSLVETMLRSVPDLRVSVATLALTRHGMSAR